MHNFKPIDTSIENGNTLRLDHCPKSNEEKREKTRIPNVKLFDVRYDVYSTRHLLRGWYNQSLSSS
jgi:hypothetical protein